MNEVQEQIKAFEEGFVYRMSLHMRIQHILFALFISILSITGLALLFSDTAIGAFLISLEGGFESRGNIHRLAAVGLVLISIYHILFILFTYSGRKEVKERAIVGRDLSTFKASLSYTLGNLDARPKIGKYGLGQKLHYWLAGIFTVSMICSGIILWNRTTGMAIFGPWVLPFIRIFHGQEGLLAFIIVVIWHLYEVHLSPRNFPMSMVWLTGKMPMKKAKEFHSLEYERLEGLIKKNEK